MTRFAAMMSYQSMPMCKGCVCRAQNGHTFSVSCLG